MKASIFLSSAFLATGVLANPTTVGTPAHVVRDTTVLASAVADVSTCASAFQLSVKGFADIGGEASVKASASALVSSLNKCSSAFSGQSVLSLMDALSLEADVGTLVSACTSISAALSAKLSLFEEVGLCSIMLGAMTDVHVAADALLSTFVNCLPGGAGSVIASLTGGLSADLGAGVYLFGSGNCTNSAGATATASLGVSGGATATASLRVSVGASGGASVGVTGSVGATGTVGVTATAGKTTIATETYETSNGVTATATTGTAGVTVTPGTTTTMAKASTTRNSSATATSPSVVTGGAVGSSIGSFGILAGVAIALVAF